MNKIYGILGVVSGLLTSAFLYFYYDKELYILRENNLLFRIFCGSVLGICVIFAIIAAKKINGNVISFMRCMFTGFIVSLINGLVYFIGFCIMYFGFPKMLVKPEQFSKEQFIKFAESQKDSTINIANALKGIHQQLTPGGFLIPSVIESVLIGLLVSIFVTAFVYTRSDKLI